MMMLLIVMRQLVDCLQLELMELGVPIAVCWYLVKVPGCW